MRLARLLGFLVLLIFLAAVFFSLLGVMGKEDLLNGTTEVSKEEIKEEEIELGEEESNLADEIAEYAVGVEEYRMGKPDIEDLYIINGATLNDVKRLVSKDVTVLVLVDTNELKNPFYETSDLVYLAVTGFNSTHVETVELDKASSEFFVYLNKDFAKAMDEAGSVLLYRL